MDKLTSVNELDAFSTRGDDNIVDWQLSREFAQVWLDDGIQAGEYPVNSTLWDIPIAIYDTQGNIKFYEFRIVDNNKTVGAIVGTATKDYDCPILYEGLTDGYIDDIERLYNEGKLTGDDLPRIVDNAYPSVALGIKKETRGDDNNFVSYLNITSGDTISKDSITYVADYDEINKTNPNLFKGLVDENKMKALIVNYNKNKDAFWKMAVANKGHISDFTARGGSKRTYIDEKNIRKTIKSTYDKYYNAFGYHNYYHVHYKDKNVYNREWEGHIADYGACGATAAGFVLDYLEANFTVYDSWKKLNHLDKGNSLYERMGIGNGLLADAIRLIGQDGDSVTLPWNIGCAIAYHSDYATVLSGFNYPKAAIEHNLPGISLRTFGKQAGMHYRPVIAYKCNGWGPFSWPSFKILDLVDCNDIISKTEGKWETYIPVHHILNWNVLTKDLIDDWEVIFEAWGDC